MIGEDKQSNTYSSESKGQNFNKKLSICLVLEQFSHEPNIKLGREFQQNPRITIDNNIRSSKPLRERERERERDWHDARCDLRERQGRVDGKRRVSDLRRGFLRIFLGHFHGVPNAHSSHGFSLRNSPEKIWISWRKTMPFFFLNFFFFFFLLWISKRKNITRRFYYFSWENFSSCEIDYFGSQVSKGNDWFALVVYLLFVLLISGV